jgi:hypothetical protein
MRNQNAKKHAAANDWCRRNGYADVKDYVEREHWTNGRPMPHLCREIGMSLPYLNKQWSQIRNGRRFIPKRPEKPEKLRQKCYMAFADPEYTRYPGAQYQGDGKTPCRSCSRRYRVKDCADDCKALSEYRADTRIMAFMVPGRDAWSTNHRVAL